MPNLDDQVSWEAAVVEVVGERLLNDFTDIVLFDRGSFGHIYRAKHKIDRQVYAVKQIQLETDELHLHQYTHRLLREVQILRSLDSNLRIVRYFNSWVEATYAEPPLEPLIAVVRKGDVLEDRYASLGNASEAGAWYSENQGSGISFRSSEEGSNGFVVAFESDDGITGNAPLLEDVSEGLVKTPQMTRMPKGLLNWKSDWIALFSRLMPCFPHFLPKTAVKESGRAIIHRTYPFDSVCDAAPPGEDREAFYWYLQHKRLEYGRAAPIPIKEMDEEPPTHVCSAALVSMDERSSPMNVQKLLKPFEKSKSVAHRKVKLNLFIQMEYYPETLEQYISKTVTPDHERNNAIVKMLVEGLSHLHKNGVMHRDLKPSNLFISSDGGLRIGDFGLACRFEHPSIGCFRTAEDECFSAESIGKKTIGVHAMQCAFEGSTTPIESFHDAGLKDIFGYAAPCNLKEPCRITPSGCTHKRGERSLVHKRRVAGIKADNFVWCCNDAAKVEKRTELRSSVDVFKPRLDLSESLHLVKNCIVCGSNVVGGCDCETTVVGTHLYASPEQLKGREHTCQVDMYTLGLLIVDLYTRSTTVMERAEVLRNARTGCLPIELEQKSPDIATFCRDLLQEDPRKRPVSFVVANQLQTTDRFQPSSIPSDKHRAVDSEDASLKKDTVADLKRQSIPLASNLFDNGRMHTLFNELERVTAAEAEIGFFRTHCHKQAIADRQLCATSTFRFSKHSAADGTISNRNPHQPVPFDFLHEYDEAYSDTSNKSKWFARRKCNTAASLQLSESIDTPDDVSCLYGCIEYLSKKLFWKRCWCTLDMDQKILKFYVSCDDSKAHRWFLLDSPNGYTKLKVSLISSPTYSVRCRKSGDLVKSSNYRSNDDTFNLVSAAFTNQAICDGEASLHCLDKISQVNINSANFKISPLVNCSCLKNYAKVHGDAALGAKFVEEYLAEDGELLDKDETMKNCTSDKDGGGNVRALRCLCELMHAAGRERSFSFISTQASGISTQTSGISTQASGISVDSSLKLVADSSDVERQKCTASCSQLLSDDAGDQGTYCVFELTDSSVSKDLTFRMQLDCAEVGTDKALVKESYVFTSKQPSENSCVSCGKMCCQMPLDRVENDAQKSDGLEFFNCKKTCLQTWLEKLSSLVDVTYS